MEKVQGYFNYDMCKECGGLCCKRYAGLYSPKDFKTSITPEFILSLLRTGVYSMDWWDGDVFENGGYSHIYYIRPRHLEEPIILGLLNDNGALFFENKFCIHWSEKKGCKLPESKRPIQCRNLIPLKNEKGKFNCHANKDDKTSKPDLVLEWRKYQSVLTRAKKMFEEEIEFGK